VQEKQSSVARIWSIKCCKLNILHVYIVVMNYVLQQKTPSAKLWLEWIMTALPGSVSPAHKVDHWQGKG
jgi:hypothetical protein